MSKKTIVFALVLALGTVFTASAGGAQTRRGEFPSRPIRITIPWAPGGTMDIMTRTIAELAPQYFSQSIVVINRDGAGGTLGVAEFVNAVPDGYNVCMMAISIFSAQPFLREVQYSLDDFEAIISLTVQPIILVVNANSPYHTIADFVAEGRRTGRTFIYGITGVGSFFHLSQAAFFSKAGLNAEHVTFPSGGMLSSALLGNHIDVAALHPADAIPLTESGHFRMLGIFSPERNPGPALRNVPTFAEQGFDINMYVWNFLMVPRGTPQDIRDRLYQGFSQILRNESFVTFAENMHFTIIPFDGPETMRRIREDIIIGERVLRDFGLIR